MGDSEDIKYSPEEVNEINRIVDLLSRTPHEPPKQQKTEIPQGMLDADADFDQEIGSDFDEEEHSELDENEADFQITEKQKEETEEVPDISEEKIPEEITFEESAEEETSFEETPGEEASFEETPEVSFEDETLSDLDLLQETPEKETTFEETPESSFGDDALSDLELIEETPVQEEAEKPFAPVEKGEYPDITDLVHDIDETGKESIELEETAEIPSIEEEIQEEIIGEFPAHEEEEKIPLEMQADEEAEDLSSLEELTALTEAPAEDTAVEAERSVPEDFSLETAEMPEEISSAETQEIPEASEESREIEIPEVEEFADEAEKISGIDFEEIQSAEEVKTAPQVIETEPPKTAVKPSAPPSGEGIDLSAAEFRKIKKTILLFHPSLTKVIKEIILKDMLPADDTRRLIDMLLAGSSEEEVLRFVEEKTGRKIDISAVPEGRRVLTSRPEYTKEGKARQEKLIKLTKIFGAVGLVSFLLTIFSYQYIYKPVMAKKKINQGTALIRKPGLPTIQKAKDYKEAEELFKYVDENYAKDYLYGYNEYAKAYFEKKEYDLALRKLNKAYNIDPVDVDTLNSLGRFYSKIPPKIFQTIKPDIKTYYFKKIPPVGPVETQIDVAIDFFTKILNKEPENITALYGIGNTYSFQGQYLKARQYFEKIIAADENSYIGYSGLLNLFIDTDAFQEVLSIHSDIYDKELLPEMPSPLLAKLAMYYLGKRRTDNMNIRVDYGIQSPLLKDLSDNPYPAINLTLEALKERDINYPPLFLVHAKLARAQGIPNLVKRNLLLAIEKEPDYLDALQMLGEYYYQTNEPVEAYKYFKRAIKANLSPPEFTQEDFYQPTEQIGKSYAMIGNIFYYFFDKVRKYRFGDDLEDEAPSNETEILANFEIAKDEYEKAILENYKSAELYYNLGRIYYMKGQYDKSTEIWLNLYEDFTTKPELMFALGNAFYHLNKLEASKGEYLKIISVYEDKERKIVKIMPENSDQIKIFSVLAAAYNNLGAVYQNQNVESKSNLSYWKSVDYAKRINRENEFARVNMARAFKPGREKVMPILDESVPFITDIYRYDIIE